MGEKHGAGRVVVRFNDVIKDFHVYHVSATDKIIETRPDLVKAFVAGWIESVAFARAHKENAIAVATQATGLDEDVSRSLYDAMMPLVSADGKFNNKAIDALARSFVDLKLLDTRPDMTPFYSERFLPGG